MILSRLLIGAVLLPVLIGVAPTAHASADGELAGVNLIGYLGWSFNNWGSCSYELVSDDRGTPAAGYGRWMFDHMLRERERGG